MLMKKEYFYPMTDIIPHITVMECMQNTIITGNQDIYPSVDNDSGN